MQKENTLQVNIWNEKVIKTAHILGEKGENIK